MDGERFASFRRDLNELFQGICNVNPTVKESVDELYDKYRELRLTEELPDESSTTVRRSQPEDPGLRKDNVRKKLLSSLSNDRDMDYSGVMDDIRSNSEMAILDGLDKLTKAMDNDRRRAVMYSGRQGSLLKELKEGSTKSELADKLSH